MLGPQRHTELAAQPEFVFGCLRPGPLQSLGLSYLVHLRQSMDTAFIIEQKSIANPQTDMNIVSRRKNTLLLSMHRLCMHPIRLARYRQFAYVK